ncbi:MAG TPA: mercuric transporter MerT family protein [Thermoanaerobaculia bacterium]|nr:mercuric transporter MerT family protein [Thermoanaerobaculia bacterium]
MSGAANAKLLSAGAVASAVAASICCFGPLALALLGLGGGALLSTLEPYRPYSLAFSGLFLGGAFYQSYRRRPDECAPGSSCARPAPRRGQRIVLWTAAIVVALAAAFPYYSRWLFE